MSVQDRWKGLPVAERLGKRWEVRYRQGGAQRKKRFDAKGVAEAFDAKQRIDPEVRQAAAGRRLTVDDMMGTWLQTKAGLKAKSQEAAATDVREVLLTFSGRLAFDVKPSEVRTWTGRDRGYSLRNRSLMALSGAYALAVADGLLKGSPCVGVPRPRTDKADKRALTWEQLERLAEAAGDYAPMIWLLATTGIRIGEACGLTVGDVSLDQGRLWVRRQVTIVGGRPVVDTPKSRKPRQVPVPQSTLADLDLDRPEDAWLFTSPEGFRINPQNWRRRVFQPAAAQAGLGDLDPHELRHTAASLAIQAGADVMVLQRMLGHARPSITLDVYSHMWDTGLDTVAAAMDQGRSKGAALRGKGANLTQSQPITAGSDPSQRVEIEA